MSTSVNMQEFPGSWTPPPSAPLDEAVWQAWVEKGNGRERRADAARLKVVKWVSIATLVAAAALWSQLQAYQVVAYFIVTCGAIAVMLDFIERRQYLFAAVFAALIVLFNPVAPAFLHAGAWQGAVLLCGAALFAFALTGRRFTPGRLAPGLLLLVFGMTQEPASAADLSRYRGFKLGANLDSICAQLGFSASEAKVIHRHPVLMQEVTWRPQGLGTSSAGEPVQMVVFSFYEGVLFRITASYDRHATEGLTAEDFIQAISAEYGAPERRSTPVIPAVGLYDDQDQIVASWQDSRYRFELIRSAYGPTFRMTGVLKRLLAPAQTAASEAKRIDRQDAPGIEAARVANEEGAAKARLEKARAANRPKFRP